MESKMANRSRALMGATKIPVPIGLILIAIAVCFSCGVRLFQTWPAVKMARLHVKENYAIVIDGEPYDSFPEGSYDDYTWAIDDQTKQIVGTTEEE